MDSKSLFFHQALVSDWGKKTLLFWTYHIIIKKVAFLTYTGALCIHVITHRTSRFGIAPERALCINALKAGSTAMALLRTLIDV